jgi:hypothetical protein
MVRSLFYVLVAFTSPSSSPRKKMENGKGLTNKPVNELSNTLDLDPLLIRAEALFRRFQRIVEAIDKKSNFPAPNFRRSLEQGHRASNSVSSVISLQSVDSAGETARTGGVTGEGRGEGAAGMDMPTSPAAAHLGGQERSTSSSSETNGQTEQTPLPATQGQGQGHARTASGSTSAPPENKNKGKGRILGHQRGSGVGSMGSGSEDTGRRMSTDRTESLQSEIAQRKVISPELRGLLSRKVEVLPRRVVKRQGGGVGKGK